MREVWELRSLRVKEFRKLKGKETNECKNGLFICRKGMKVN
jgi:hypothetical protein